jgi:hypothetical protein
MDDLFLSPDFDAAKWVHALARKHDDQELRQMFEKLKDK